MTDPPGTILPSAGTGGLDALLATKLYLPRRRPGFITRPRLTERLDENLTRGLVLVCAPAGFGKTALLADWARRSRRPTAWLSLDQGDNDPARFWRHVIAALERVRPGTVEQLAPLLGPPSPPAFGGLVTALINDLAGSPGADEMVLVLDDYHLIDAQPVHAALGFLLDHRPAALRLVLASRADPPLALARLRGRGQLAELREAELRFTAEEAAALLHQAAGSALPEDAVAALTARTEGWVVGLQLASLSLRQHSDVAGFLATFSGSHRYVLDYLTEEVLEHQPDEVRSFLLETSILERLSGGLCDAVTGRPGGQAMLERLERANLFLVPLDEVRGWWRYHQLFADLLRARLQRERPRRVPALHHNAAAWQAEHGLADDAVGHALAAGDAAWAARLVEQQADALLARSEGATLLRWLEALPVDLVRCRPRLLLAQARLAIFSRRLAGADSLLDAAERARDEATAQADEPFEPSVGRPASVLANVPAAITLQRAILAELHGDAEGTVAHASQALAMLGPGEWMLAALARTHLAVAEWLSGRLPQAERAFAASAAQWRAAGESFPAAWSSHQLGEVQRAQGRLGAALETYRQALEIAAGSGRTARPTAGIAHVGLAEVAYQQGELEVARGHLAEGIPLCRQLIYPQPLAAGLAVLAWIRQAADDHAGALEAMEEAERAGPVPGVTSLLNPVPAQRARLLLAQGDIAAAAAWTEERGLEAGDRPSYAREPEYLVLARVLLARGLARPGACPPRADARPGSGPAADGQPYRTAGAARLGPGGRRGGGQRGNRPCPGVRPGLPRTLRAALRRRRRTHGRPDRPPSRRPADQADRRWPYPARLPRPGGARVRAGPGCGLPDGRAGTAVAAALIVALSDRELEVLRLLAAGKPNQQIAEELVVARSTVKKHVVRILGKLGATNRTEATARARELGLLP